MAFLPWSKCAWSPARCAAFLRQVAHHNGSNKSGALQKAPLLLSKIVLPFLDRKNILILNDKYIPVYNAYSGQTETMQAKWANLKKMEEETFAKIIMGKADISEFDTFVENWKNQGGDQILKEINEELNNSSGN